MADFRSFLASEKGAFSKDLREEFSQYANKYEAVAREQAKYFRPEGEKLAAEIQKKAEDDPTPENVAVLNANHPDDVRKRFENTLSVLTNKLDRLVKESAGVTERIRDAALRVVDGQIERVELEGRSIAERYQLAYSPEQDATALALRKWRAMAVHRASRPMAPTHIVETFGELRKRGAFGF